MRPLLRAAEHGREADGPAARSLRPGRWAAGWRAELAEPPNRTHLGTTLLDQARNAKARLDDRQRLARRLPRRQASACVPTGRNAGGVPAMRRVVFGNRAERSCSPPAPTGRSGAGGGARAPIGAA